MNTECKDQGEELWSINYLTLTLNKEALEQHVGSLTMSITEEKITGFIRLRENASRLSGNGKHKVS